MQKRTVGTVIAVKKLWWLKINTKPIRKGPLDGAVFPHVVRVRYTVNGREYLAGKWVMPQYPLPAEGDTVQLVYDERRPEKVRIVY